MTPYMTRRGFLTSALATATFGAPSTQAHAQTDAEIAIEQYDRIRRLINTPHMQALQEAAYKNQHRLTPQDHEYFNALNRIRDGRVRNDIGGKGVLAYCVANGTRRTMDTLLEQTQNDKMTETLSETKRLSAKIESTLNRALYDGQANPRNCSQVYQKYTY